MKDPIEDYLDRLLAPNAIDPYWIAVLDHPYRPEYTLQELEALIRERAIRDGYQCVYQGPYEWELKQPAPSMEVAPSDLQGGTFSAKMD